jgi:hypothetical protein
MNKKVMFFFQESSGDDSPTGHFHKVVALHNSPFLEWEALSQKVPSLPRGWYELARLSSAYRVEFVHDYWVAKLPFHPNFNDFLTSFFDNLEDIGIYLTQQTFDDPFEVKMVYAQKGDGGFFHGSPPCSEEGLIELRKEFPGFIFPADYQPFLQIHDGFSKYTDTGLIKTPSLLGTYQAFQIFLSVQDPLLSSKNEPIDPKGLIPFYESFGLHCYQCFNLEWYPEQEMGNVYYSGIEHTISDIRNRNLWTENLAFPTFLDWLLFYLKGVDEI